MNFDLDVLGDVIVESTSEKELDFMDTPIMESEDFVKITPEGGLKEDYSGGAKDKEIPVPEGDKETPTAKNPDQTPIQTGHGTEINVDVYKKALSDLKQSFKESIEVMELIEKGL